MGTQVTIDLTGLPDDVQKSVAALVGENERLTADLTAANDLLAKSAETGKNEPKVEPAQTDILKSADPAVQELFKSMQANIDAANAKAEAAAKAADIEKSARETAEFTAIFKSEYGNVPGDLNELAKAYREAQTVLSDESWKTIETSLRATNEQITKGDLFASKGQHANNSPTSDAGEQLHKAATALMVEDKTLSYGEAISKAASADPGLANQYKAGL